MVPNKIACLGWGSLIWDPRDLLNDGQWCSNSPFLPIEYTRQSADGRLTLVISPEFQSVPVLWSMMKVPSL